MTSGTSPSQGSPQVLTTTGFDEVDTPQMRRFQRRVTLLSAGGTFLDGFVRFTSRTEGQPDLAVPYLGFYGSWGTPSIFDQLVSEGDGHAASSASTTVRTATSSATTPSSRRPIAAAPPTPSAT